MAYEEAFVSAEGPDALDKAETSQSMEEVERALASLPGGQREAFVLTKVVGLSVQEASAVLSISEGATKVKVHRALGAIRGLLKRDRPNKGE